MSLIHRHPAQKILDDPILSHQVTIEVQKVFSVIQNGLERIERILNDPERRKNQEEMVKCFRKDLSALARQLMDHRDISIPRDEILKKRSALHTCAENGLLETAEALLDLGVQVATRDQDLNTPLHLAAVGGHPAIVKKLLEKSAPVNACNASSETPLHLATRGGHSAVVEALLENGARVNSCRKDLKTALHVAAELGHCAVVEALLKHPQNNNNVEDAGALLRSAAVDSAQTESGNLATVQELLQKLALVSAQSNLLETPLQLAINNGHVDVVEILLAHGADL